MVLSKQVRAFASPYNSCALQRGGRRKSAIWVKSKGASSRVSDSFKGLPMKIELRINGRYEIELSPESEIERLILLEISDRADKGQSLSFAADQDSRCRLGVDK